jgi:hypothetical protein
MRERIFIIPSIRGLIYFGVAVLLFLITYARSSILVSITTLVCLSFYILSMLMAQRNLKGLGIAALEINDFECGQKGELILTIINSQAYQRNHLNFELIDKNKKKWVVLSKSHSVIPEHQNRVTFNLAFERSREPEKRGFYQIDQARFRSPYPFAWFTGLKLISVVSPFYIYPQAKNILDEVSQRHLFFDGDFHQHQNYRGQNAHVDWKLFARRNLLLQKNFEDENPLEFEIRWDDLKDLVFEDRLSQICYWILHKPDSQNISVVLPNINIIIDSKENKIKALRELALMQELKV